MKYFYDNFYELNTFDPKNKKRLIGQYIRYMYSRTQSMFKYTGLPDTLKQKYLELYMQNDGAVGVAKVDGNLYAFSGGLGGEPDPYYFPTIFTVANPALKFSANLKIGEDVVIVKNDSMLTGLLPMFSRYASLMAENDLTMRISDINCRIASLITAGTDSARAAAELFLKQIEAGELGVMADSSFIEAIKTQPYGSASQTNSLTDLIEYHQYLKASWFNDLGLNANYNMKRESINSNEAQLNDDCLLPLVDDMLRCRKEGIEEVNRMFGTEISVDLNSAWEEEQEKAAEEDTSETPEEEPEQQEEGKADEDQ